MDLVVVRDIFEGNRTTAEIQVAYEGSRVIGTLCRFSVLITRGMSSRNVGLGVFDVVKGDLTERQSRKVGRLSDGRE